MNIRLGTQLIPDKRKREVRKRAFSIWQQRPYQVDALSEEQHTCQSCGTVYQGNYCPRCGQSARIGRFSFKTALMLFIDVWGLGNRSMFRTIRDLMLRPGYMIRDYLRGCQSAYFPPFKMFFILATFSWLLSHGLDFWTEEPGSQVENRQTESNEATSLPTDSLASWKDKEGDVRINGKAFDRKTFQQVRKLPDLEKKNPALFALFSLILMSAPFYLFVRKCPNIPDLRYSEHLVAMVYTSNMYSLYRILATITPFGLSYLIRLFAVLMIFITLKQFTGYSKRRLLSYFTLTIIVSTIAVIVLFLLIIAIISLFV